MILEIILIVMLSYIFIGLLLWIIPFNSGAGYSSCGFEDYNILFIVFWLLAPFNKNIKGLISK